MSASRTHLPRIESMEEKGRRLSEGSTVRSGIRLVNTLMHPIDSFVVCMFSRQSEGRHLSEVKEEEEKKEITVRVKEVFPSFNDEV